MHFLIYHRRCVSRFRQISREISCVKTIINLAASGGYKLLKLVQATFVWTPAPDCVYLDNGAHLACELRALHGVPHLVRQPLRVLAGGGVVVQTLVHHPVSAAHSYHVSGETLLYLAKSLIYSPELLQMTVTSPGVLMQFQTFDVCCCKKDIFLYHRSQSAHLKSWYQRGRNCFE